MNAIEMLEAEYEVKRTRLMKNMELAKELPTNGVVVSWIGEGGWNGNDRLPDIIKTCELVPWVFHSSCYLTQAKHVSFKAPDSFPWTNGTGEHVSSKFRNSFLLKYIKAILDAVKPYQVGLTACQGRYKGVFPTSFNFLEHKDYADAATIGHGMCEVYVTRALGENSFTSGTFSIYVLLPVTGLVKIDIELPSYGRLAPIAHGITQYGSSPTVQSVNSWQLPKFTKPPVAAFKFGGGDSGNRTSTVRYLFSTVDECMDLLGIKFNQEVSHG
jgi:hypothetical protein